MSPQNPPERASDRKMQEIVDGYMNRVIGLARKRLSPALQQKIAPEDIAQSVLRTFFRRYEFKGQFHDVNDGASLWRLLAKITVTRCWKAAQHFSTGKRSLNRETPMESPREDERDAFQPAAGEVSPLDALILRETLERCFEAEGVDAGTRRVIEGWLGGASFAEIAAAPGVGLSPAAVRGLCHRFIRAVEAMARREDEGA